MPTTGLRTLSAIALIAGLSASSFATDPWAEPAGFYSSVTGTGATLKSQLSSRMSQGHIQRNYGDFRYAAPLFHTDPNNASRILLVYNRASVSSVWDAGATWNREHVWPQSLQPGDASNSSTGNLGDHHALMPCNPSINSSRGNKPFGWSTTTGLHGSQGTHYFPGDADKGDIARMLFYSDTRWGPSLGLSLVTGSPSGNQMGDLNSLIAWNYLDAPDEFERRRNHVIYSIAHNPSCYTNNRNAFIDRPWYVWSVYVDQQNDSQLSIASPDANGASTLDVEVSAFVGTAVPQQTVSLIKTGFDATYYSVSVSGDATSTVEGAFNAFPIITGVGVDMESFQVGVAAPASAGLASGQVIIDNLDVTTGAGPGMGANDADDVVTLSVTALDRPEGSFDPAVDVDMLQIDFGSAPVAPGSVDLIFELHNLEATAGFTGGLLVTGVDPSGDVAQLVLGPAPLGVIDAGASEPWIASMSLTAPGDFSATYVIHVADDPSVLGAGVGTDLILELTGTVTGDCPADLDGSGTLTLDDVVLFTDAFGASDLAADLDGDGFLTLDDVVLFADSFASGCA